MIILAFDTSSVSQSVALLDSEKILSEVFLEKTSGHAETLLDSIQSVLAQSGRVLKDVDLYAVTVGPGSFTGLRIGISVLKALSIVHPRPVANVSTLMALAEPHLNQHAAVVAGMDARCGEIYGAVYRLEGLQGPIRTLWEPEVSKADRFIEKISGLKGKKIFVGSAGGPYEKKLREVPQLEVLTSTASSQIQAAVIARLGQEFAAAGKVMEGRVVKATYLRASAAEQKLGRPGPFSPEADPPPVEGPGLPVPTKKNSLR